MTWSRNARLFPSKIDQGGYLPVAQILRTIVNRIGYRGWVSMESSCFGRELVIEDLSTAHIYAERAKASWSVHAELGWENYAKP
jgi:4-hydroxyphenylpyruvate dioxygenase